MEDLSVNAEQFDPLSSLVRVLQGVAMIASLGVSDGLIAIIVAFHGYEESFAPPMPVQSFIGSIPNEKKRRCGCLSYARSAVTFRIPSDSLYSYTLQHFKCMVSPQQETVLTLREIESFGIDDLVCQLTPTHSGAWLEAMDIHCKLKRGMTYRLDFPKEGIFHLDKTSCTSDTRKSLTTDKIYFGAAWTRFPWAFVSESCPGKTYSIAFS